MERCWTSSPFIVASSWCINVVTHRCRVPWPCCCRPVLLSLARCGPVLCLNEVGWGEGGMGYLPSINNNERQMLFVVLVATSLSATWHLHSPLAAGGCFHLLAVVSIRAWSFPSVHGRFPLWAVVCVRTRSFSFVAVIFVRLRSWPVVYVHGRSFAFVGGRFRCLSWLAVGAVSWLSWAASFSGRCRG